MDIKTDETVGWFELLETASIRSNPLHLLGGGDIPFLFGRNR